MKVRAGEQKPYRHAGATRIAGRYRNGACTYRNTEDISIGLCLLTVTVVTTAMQEGSLAGSMSTKDTAKKNADLQHPLPGIEGSLSRREQLAIISRIPAHESHEEQLVPNYQPDRAIREAVTEEKY